MLYPNRIQLSSLTHWSHVETSSEARRQQVLEPTVATWWHCFFLEGGCWRGVWGQFITTVTKVIPRSLAGSPPNMVLDLVLTSKLQMSRDSLILCESNIFALALKSSPKEIFLKLLGTDGLRRLQLQSSRYGQTSRVKQIQTFHWILKCCFCSTQIAVVFILPLQARSYWPCVLKTSNKLKQFHLSKQLDRQLKYSK